MHDSWRQTSVHTPLITFQYCAGVGTAAGTIISTTATCPGPDTPINHLKKPYGKVTPPGFPDWFGIAVSATGWKSRNVPVVTIFTVPAPVADAIKTADARS